MKPNSPSRHPACLLTLALLLPFLALAGCRAAGTPAPGLDSGYRTEGVRATLDEAALRQSMAAYWSAVVNQMPFFKDGEKIALAPEAFEVQAAAPVQKGGNVYFAVRLGLRDAKKYYLAPPFPLTVVVDPTGTLFFPKVIDIASRREAILDRAPAVTQIALPAGLDATLVRRGTGATDVTIISDPLCGYCRKGYAFVLRHMDAVRNLTVVHNILFAGRGSDVAAWMMEYARTRPVDLAAIYGFSYARLRGVEPLMVDGKPRQRPEDEVAENILGQYKAAFPALFEETGGDVRAMYALLSGRYAERTAANRDRLVEALMASTPMFVVKGEIVRDFDEARLARLLGVAASASPSASGECSSGDQGICAD